MCTNTYGHIYLQRLYSPSLQCQCRTYTDRHPCHGCGHGACDSCEHDDALRIFIINEKRQDILVAENISNVRLRSTSSPSQHLIYSTPTPPADPHEFLLTAVRWSRTITSRMMNWFILRTKGTDYVCGKANVAWEVVLFVGRYGSWGFKPHLASTLRNFHMVLPHICHV